MIETNLGPNDEDKSKEVSMETLLQASDILVPWVSTVHSALE